jgi:hypothetical protein
MTTIYTSLTNAFFAIGGFVFAIVGMFSVLCLLLRIYFWFEGLWDFAADKLREDAGHDWPDGYGDIPSPITNPECVDALHRSGDRP